MDKNYVYACIDMKSFFASVECAERGLNPFETPLVVADVERTNATICLAVSPMMKALGVKNRCRLFQIPKDINYIIAKPRMQKYVDYAAQIYKIYLKYMDKDSIHVYSIDECFLDITDYCNIYKKSPREFVRTLMDEIATTLGIPATAGIGTNLYLAKIALDITAKHSPGRMGVLSEEKFINTLWNHQPITDFWGISTGISNRLQRMGIYNMRGIAQADEAKLYKEFGINAELLIDHAWGRETCLMCDIKSYKAKSKSVSSSQILPRDYSYEEARVVIDEMARLGCAELSKRELVANKVSIFIGYADRNIPTSSGGKRMIEHTNLPAIIRKYVKELYEQVANPSKAIRKIGICFERLSGEECEGYDLFTNFSEIERQKRVNKAVLDIQAKFGKNAIIMGIDLTESATIRERNKLIGGHNGGV